jgi:hypothetical protein
MPPDCAEATAANQAASTWNLSEGGEPGVSTFAKGNASKHHSLDDIQYGSCNQPGTRKCQPEPV